MQGKAKNIGHCLKMNQTTEGVYWAAIKPRLDRNCALYENN